MKKGIILAILQKYMGDKEKLDEVLGRAKEMGYEAVQYIIPDYVTPEEYKELLDKHGMKYLCCGAKFEAMDEDPQATREAIELSDLFETDYIDVNTMPLKYRETEEGFREYARRLNAIAQVVKKSGKKILYHPHALEYASFGDGKIGMDILIQETDSEGVNFILDTHWMACGGVVLADWIRKVKGRMKIIHFKDYAIVPGVEGCEQVDKRFAEVGQGNIDWPSVVAACKEIGVEYAVVEQDSCYDKEPYGCAKRSMEGMIKFGV